MSYNTGTGNWIGWVILVIVISAMISMAGNDQDKRDPCLFPNPPAHCQWSDNGIGDDK